MVERTLMLAGANDAPPVLLIAGQTASGKSALALEMAERLDGEIINADSMQIYRDLPLLSAQPSAEEKAQRPHHLYGFLAAGEVFSAGLWREQVERLVKEIHARGRWAIITGGTGLYFSALLKGLAPLPEIPDAIRTSLRRRMAQEGSAALHEELREADPETAARIPPTDPQRILRGLEILAATGKRWSVWLAEAQAGGQQTPLLDGAAIYALALTPPTDWLEARIAERTDSMLRAGVVEEVRAFLARLTAKEAKNSPLLKTAGIRPLQQFLCGDIEEAALKQAIVLETRRYAKRQRTWIRTQMPEWEQTAAPSGAALVKRLLTLRGGYSTIPPR